MKNIDCFLAMVLLTTLSWGSADAQVFAPTGAQWYYAAQNAAPPTFSGYVHFEATTEIEIENRPCRQVTQTYFDYTNQITTQAAYYICTQADTAFYFDFGNPIFYVLYIFNREAGDTLTLDWPDPASPPGTTYRVVIDSVRSLLFDGQVLKTYHTSALDNFGIAGSGVFADRIGGLTWFYPTSVVGIPEGPGPIRCYSDMEIDTNFNSYPCDLHLEPAVEDKNNTFSVTIFPNPTDGLFRVETPVPIAEIAVFDLPGRLLTQVFDDNQADLSPFRAGMYRVSVRWTNGASRWVFIVKTE